MIMKPEEAIKYYNPPFEYNLHAQIILSKEESGKHVMHLCDIRGHGSLVGNTYNLNFEEAAKVQDAVGRFVTEAVNEKLTKPHVLTYEDLACQQGSELLTRLFMHTYATDGYVTVENRILGTFIEIYEKSEGTDYEDELLAECRIDGLFSEDMPANWQLILAGYNDEMEQVGHDWEMPNGETVKAIFLPKTQVND